jgi:hypothetical protein
LLLLLAFMAVANQMNKWIIIIIITFTIKVTKRELLISRHRCFFFVIGPRHATRGMTE